MFSTYAAFVTVLLVGIVIGLLIAHLCFQKPTPVSSGFKLVGGYFMRTYAEDRPADTSSFTKASVVDSEGGAVDPQPDLTYTFSSDKPGICDIKDNGDGTVTTTYGTAAKLPDGSYDIATLRGESNEIPDGSGGVIKDVVQDQVQLVPGAAAGFGTGGAFNLPT